MAQGNMSIWHHEHEVIDQVSMPPPTRMIICSLYANYMFADQSVVVVLSEISLRPSTTVLRYGILNTRWKKIYRLASAGGDTWTRLCRMGDQVTPKHVHQVMRQLAPKYPHIGQQLGDRAGI